MQAGKLVNLLNISLIWKVPFNVTLFRKQYIDLCQRRYIHVNEKFMCEIFDLGLQ